jgi:hypothetical protein
MTKVSVTGSAGKLCSMEIWRLMGMGQSSHAVGHISGVTVDWTILTCGKVEAVLFHKHRTGMYPMADTAA